MKKSIRFIIIIIIIIGILNEGIRIYSGALRNNAQRKREKEKIKIFVNSPRRLAAFESSTKTS